jgi:hypothetical protein
LFLQGLGERSDRRIAARLGVESYDDRVGSEPRCNDFCCPCGLAAKYALAAEETE